MEGQHPPESGGLAQVLIFIYSEESTSAAAHGSVDRAASIEHVLDRRKRGILLENRSLEVIAKVFLPGGNILCQYFPKRFLRQGRDNAAIGVGGRDRHSLRDKYFQPITGQVHLKGLQYLSAAGSQHGPVVNEEGAVASEAGGIAGQRYNGTHVSKIIPYRGGYALQCSTDGNRHRIELLERDSTTGCLVRNAIPFSGLPTKQTPCLYADGDILWMGFKGQLFSYNPHVQYSYSEPFNALIRRVTFKDSLLFDGAYTEQLADGSLAITNAQGHSDVPTMRYSHNAMEVHVGAPFFDYEEATQFAHYLEGSDETTWSAWSNRTSVVYTNLHEGRYTFHVKARNIYGTESTVASFSFRIKPPWYRTIAAFLLYIVVAVLLVWRIVRWNAKRLEAENKRLEAIVQERTAEVVAQKEEIEAQKEVLHEQNREITSSIQYASRIQHTMLSPEEVVTEIFPDNFILYLPRDIVSGDFYVIMQVGNKKISAVADCTGHGVPGGFMSMLGMSSINEIVTKNVNNLHPDVILFKLREKVIHSLHQTGEVGTSKDGMDMALYIVDETEMTLEFAGANNSLVLIRDGEVIQLKADKMPIGFYLKGDIPFTNHKMDLKKGDCIYTFSDGYADQFGGTDGRKFMSKNLRALLLEIHQKPMAEQHDILAHRLVEWHGDSPRIDDVVVMGVRI